TINVIAPVNARDQYQLGRSYETGTLFVPQDKARAEALYRKAAEQGYDRAQYALADLAPSDAEAVFWYRKAADQGYAPADDELGRDYEEGWGVREDYTQAVAWYRKAAAKDYMEALESLGEMYEQGRGVPKDLPQAIDWYRKAEQRGSSSARNAL